MFMNFSENLLTIVDNISEYIIVVKSKLFIIAICDASKNDNENINTATAIPFGIFNVIKRISSLVCPLLCSVIFTAMNLVITNIENIVNDFNMKSPFMLSLIMKPISKNTSISSEFDNIPLNSCKISLFETYNAPNMNPNTATAKTPLPPKFSDNMNASNAEHISVSPDVWSENFFIPLKNMSPITIPDPIPTNICVNIAAKCASNVIVFLFNI